MDFRDLKEFLCDAAKLVLTIVIVLFIVVYIVSVQQVVGPSMSPTFKNKDVLILKKFYYHIFDVKRFDVISLEHTGSKYLIKRVIGLPGETIEYKNNNLYVNNQLVDEPFLKDDVITEDFNIAKLGSITVPKDKYFVLGDNRTNSLDSRKIGFIDKKAIIGKVNLRIWPINSFKYVK